MPFRWRRPTLRFSLATLLIVTTFCGLLAWRAQERLGHYRQQAKTIADLRALGATIFTYPDPNASPWSAIPGVDQDIFAVASEVYLPNHEDVDEHLLPVIERMTELRTLHLPASIYLTDESARFLQNFTSLEGLVIESNSITDASIERLTHLHRLQTVSLNGAKLGDRSLKALSKLPALEAINFFDGVAVDSGLEYVTQMSRLRQLGLSGKFTDDGLETLVRCRNLETLSLTTEDATDRTLRAIQTMPRLKELTILGGVFTDDVVLKLGASHQFAHFFCSPDCIAGAPENHDKLVRLCGDPMLNVHHADPARFFEAGGIVENEKLIVGDKWTGMDRTLCNVRAFDGVTSVHINSPRVRDGGIGRLALMGNNLKTLTIQEASITPGVIPYLAKLPLRRLSLRSSRIDDLWAARLAELKNIEDLELVDTRISSAGLEELREAGIAVTSRATEPVSPEK